MNAPGIEFHRDLSHIPPTLDQYPNTVDVATAIAHNRSRQLSTRRNDGLNLALKSTKKPMQVQIATDVRLFADVEGVGLVPDGPAMRQKPTLILLHGGPGYDHTSFKPTFSRLADIAQVVYYDHRGHGRSDPRPKGELSLDIFADDVVRLCDALGISKPIVLGQSFGGFVAQRYIARHPEHPAKVILSSTSPNLGLARKLVMFEQLGGIEAREVAERFWTAPSKSSWAAYKRVCKHLYNTVAPASNEAALRIKVNEEILFWWVGGEQQTMSLLPGLARARCPVLVLAGELDPVCPLDDARDIAAALPSHWARFAQFGGCGHGVWRDDPDAAFTLLREFIVEQHGATAATLIDPD